MNPVVKDSVRGGAAVSVDSPVRGRSVRLWNRHARKVTEDGPISWLFAVPALVILFLFCIYPFANTIRLSFTNSRMLIPGNAVGFENYVKLFHDSRFLTALLNSALYVVCVVPFMVILPLVLAVLVTRKSKVIGFFRTTYYFPVVMSAVVVGLIWTNLLDTRGLINSVLQSLRVITEPIPFLTDRWLTLFLPFLIKLKCLCAPSP